MYTHIQTPLFFFIFSGLDFLMGIQGLLPFLKKIHKPVNIAQFRGYTVAIDAYCWLHKGAFACADKLALGEKTDQWVPIDVLVHSVYCLH